MARVHLQDFFGLWVAQDYGHTHLPEYNATNFLGCKVKYRDHVPSSSSTDSSNVYMQVFETIHFIIQPTISDNEHLSCATSFTLDPTYNK